MSEKRAKYEPFEGKSYVTTYTGQQTTGALTTYNADGTPASLSITLLSPYGAAVDGAGNIYISSLGGSLTNYNSSGTAGPTITGLSAPTGLAVH